MRRHPRLQETGHVGPMQWSNHVRFSWGAMQLRIEIQGHDEYTSEETSQQVPTIASAPVAAAQIARRANEYICRKFSLPHCQLEASAISPSIKSASPQL